MKTVALFLLLSMPFTTTGCLPIMVHAAIVSDAQETAAYSAYRDTMQQTNTDRQLAGLAACPILTRHAWRATLHDGSDPPPLKSPHDL